MKLGQHMSDEQRSIDSLVHMGHVVSVEARLKMSASHLDPTINEEHICRQCGKAFFSRNRQRQYCSPECCYASRMGNKHCVGRVPWNKGIPWSPEARTVLSANHADVKRERNPAWKGGTMSENHIARSSPKYLVWRDTVFKRDDYTCQECGEHSGNGHAVIFEAHHVHGFADYPDERFDVDNGKTLCKKCHDKTKGRRRNVEVRVLYVPKGKR